MRGGGLVALVVLALAATGFGQSQRYAFACDSCRYETWVKAPSGWTVSDGEVVGSDTTTSQEPYIGLVRGGCEAQLRQTFPGGTREIVASSLKPQQFGRRKLRRMGVGDLHVMRDRAYLLGRPQAGDVESVLAVRVGGDYVRSDWDVYVVRALTPAGEAACSSGDRSALVAAARQALEKVVRGARPVPRGR